MPENENYFAELNDIDVSKKTKKKGKFNYLSWVHAWGELKKRYPDANYTVYENDRGWNYHTDTNTCWVKVGVTVCGIEHVEYYPIIDYSNKSIPLELVTSMDVNKAIKRAMTKAIAEHGLGLFVFEGEDLPEATKETLKALDNAKQALTDYCYQFDPSGKVAAKVWKKYKVDEITDPDEITAILTKYKTEAEAKAKAQSELPEEV